MGELKASNDLLGDRAALQAAWDRDGYWYFKDVLDRDFLWQFKQYWLDFLKQEGFVDDDAQHAIYNGSGLNNKRVPSEDLYRLEHLNSANAHELFTKHPKINAVIREIIGDDPFWLPIAEYRAAPPGADPCANRLFFPHQDGFYNPGIEMKTCWVPLEPVDDELGGCAWAEGRHNGPILHDLKKPPLFPVPLDSLPLDGWKRGNFQPGDVVIFHRRLPHSAITNISKDRFRLSMDIRLVEASGKVPSIGRISSLSPDSVSIVNETTAEAQEYTIVDATFCRTAASEKLIRSEIARAFQIGERVIVGTDDGKTATVLRSVH